MTLSNASKGFLCFALALVARLGYFFYNLSWNLPETWPNVAIQSLVAAEAILGRASSYPEFGAEAALNLFRLDDRGLTFFHLFVSFLFGKSSLHFLSVINILLDSTFVFFVIFLFRKIWMEKYAYFAGFFYATFLPQIFISIHPLWYTFLNLGNFSILSLAIWIYTKENPKFRHFFLCAFAVFLVTFFTSQFRSTIIFFPLFLAVLSILLKGKKLVIFTPLFLGGILAILGSAQLNYYYVGKFSPTRSNTGHAFWVGVGEFENPLGIIESDDSVIQFYQKQTGKTLNYSSNDSFLEYENWLKIEAKEFVINHPILYLSMTLRRALKIIFPNFRLQRVADEEAYMNYVQKADAAKRMEITKTGKLFSLSGIVLLWKNFPEFFIELLVRAFYFFSLPFGLLLGFIYSRNNPLLLLSISGFLYGILTISPLRGPVMNHYSIWTITTPIVFWGWLSFGFLLCSAIQKKRRNA